MESIEDKIRREKESNRIAMVSYFNDGTVRTDKRFMVERLKKAIKVNDFKPIEQEIIDSALSYQKYYDFNILCMKLYLGLIYGVDDVNTDYSLKETSEPVNNMVRYYTGRIDSFLDNERTNLLNYEEYGMSVQGFINYDFLLRSIKERGLVSNMPDTYEEFKERVLSGEIFDITVVLGKDRKENHKDLTREKHSFKK